MKHAIMMGMIVTTLFAAVDTFADHGERPAGNVPAHHGTPAEYLVISPHRETDCIQALDEVQALGANALDKWKFGCVDGDHTGYCVVSASNPDEALLSVPPSLRSKARAVRLHRFTAAELKAIHLRLNS